MNKNEYASLITDIHKKIKKEALQKAASMQGKVTAVVSGNKYDVTTADGKVYKSVGSLVPKYKFKVGTWVTVEFTSTDWQIIGFSGTAASDD